MKRIFALVLCFVLLLTQTGLGDTFKENAPDTAVDIGFDQFTGLDDPDMLQYIEDSIYMQLVDTFDSDDYIIDDISVIYISQEYLDEVAFNTRLNIYFGYTLSELDAAFEGKRYIFTYDGIDQTVVREFVEFPDNTDEIILKNLMIGTGVILICVTVTVISAGAASGAAVAGSAKTISLIFSASAETATKMALSTAVIKSATTAVVRGYESGDLYETIRAAELSGSEGFKMGAIIGAVSGGVNESIRISKIRSKPIPSPQDSEQHVYDAYNCTRKQVSYLNRQEVNISTPNATRPDCIRYIEDHWEAIEVKNYDLIPRDHRNVLKNELLRQIEQRCNDLPADMTQRVVLDVTGRGYTQEFIQETVEWIHGFLDPVCPGIPIDVFGDVL